MSDSESSKKVSEEAAAVGTDSAKKEEQENIFLFVPNLIGYARIVLAILSFWFMPTNHILSGKMFVCSSSCHFLNL